MVLEALVAVFAPLVVHIAQYPLVQRVWQRLIHCKPCETSQPLVEVFALVDGSHLFLLVSHNFNEGTHDVGEESHTQHHHYHRGYHFKTAYGVEISISNRRERGQRKVATDHNLTRFLSQVVLQIPCLPLPDALFAGKLVRNVEPNAAQEISDYQRDDNHSDHLIKVENVVLFNNFFVVICVAAQAFQYVLYTVNIDQFGHSGQTRKPNQLEALSIFVLVAQQGNNLRKWKDGHKVNHQPAKQVLLCYSLKVSDVLVGVFMAEALEEVEYEIEVEEALQALVEDESPFVGGSCEGHVVHVGGAGVAHQE